MSVSSSPHLGLKLAEDATVQKKIEEFPIFTHVRHEKKIKEFEEAVKERKSELRDLVKSKITQFNAENQLEDPVILELVLHAFDNHDYKSQSSLIAFMRVLQDPINKVCLIGRHPEHREFHAKRLVESLLKLKYKKVNVKLKEKVHSIVHFLVSNATMYFSDIRIWLPMITQFTKSIIYKTDMDVLDNGVNVTSESDGGKEDFLTRNKYFAKYLMTNIIDARIALRFTEKENGEALMIAQNKLKYGNHLLKSFIESKLVDPDEPFIKEISKIMYEYLNSRLEKDNAINTNFVNETGRAFKFFIELSQELKQCVKSEELHTMILQDLKSRLTNDNFFDFGFGNGKLSSETISRYGKIAAFVQSMSNHKHDLDYLNASYYSKIEKTVFQHLSFVLSQPLTIKEVERHLKNLLGIYDTIFQQIIKMHAELQMTEIHRVSEEDMFEDMILNHLESRLDLLKAPYDVENFHNETFQMYNTVIAILKRFPHLMDAVIVIHPTVEIPSAYPTVEIPSVIVTIPTFEDRKEMFKQRFTRLNETNKSIEDNRKSLTEAMQGLIKMVPSEVSRKQYEQQLEQYLYETTDDTMKAESKCRPDKMKTESQQNACKKEKTEKLVSLLNNIIKELLIPASTPVGAEPIREGEGKVAEAAEVSPDTIENDDETGVTARYDPQSGEGRDNDGKVTWTAPDSDSTILLREKLPTDITIRGLDGNFSELKAAGSAPGKVPLLKSEEFKMDGTGSMWYVLFMIFAVNTLFITYVVPVILSISMTCQLEKSKRKIKTFWISFMILMSLLLILFGLLSFTTVDVDQTVNFRVLANRKEEGDVHTTYIRSENYNLVAEEKQAIMLARPPVTGEEWESFSKVVTRMSITAQYNGFGYLVSDVIIPTLWSVGGVFCVMLLTVLGMIYITYGFVLGTWFRVLFSRSVVRGAGSGLSYFPVNMGLQNESLLRNSAIFARSSAGTFV